jgi:hypothetical protein
MSLILDNNSLYFKIGEESEPSFIFSSDDVEKDLKNAINKGKGKN